MSEPMTTRRPRPAVSRAVLMVVGVLVAYAVVGLVAGVVWERVWTPPSQVVQQHQVFYADYASLRRVFTGTGLYAIVAVIASAVVALVVGLVTRGRELLVLATVVLGSALASLVMWKVGVRLGPPDPAAAAAHLADGRQVPGALAVSGHSPYLVWPMTSMFVLALMFFTLPAARAGREQAAPADHSEARVEEPRHR